ncbi:unnamed protein product [Mytilus coruscus]|uniref:CCHC-type domain-containing protein n=1 Tax=Mytilus coruscus TaxID=42192 RepID=A0A6J8BY12_MYTCO|nr:unnamed protein product [Mytilus coruscus]
MDEEQDTMKVRVKNVPLSADDDQIIRTLETTASKCEVITHFKKRLRIDNLLTNCRTGDRIVICKPFNPPLPKSLQIGKYWATINQFGQSFTNRPNMKCSKCFEEGHSANNCPNGWKCRKCGQLGHKQYECNEHSDGEYDEDDTYMTNMDDVGNQDVPNASENDEHNKDCPDNSDKSFQESEVYSQRRTKTLVNTEDRSRSDSDKEHSLLILGTQERRFYRKDSSQQQNQNQKT